MKRLSIFFILLLCAVTLFAQKPSIGFVYPAGVRPGQTVEITVGGQNIANVTEAIISGDGVETTLHIDNSTEGKARNKISKKNIGEEDNLQIAQRVKITVKVSDKATPGLRDLRLVSPKGVSNRLFFEIGGFDNALEKEPNSSFAQSNFIKHLPCTINGQIMMSDKDYFTFEAKKGQTIVANVKARYFTPYIADAVPGWFQPTLAMYDERGVEVAYSDDWNYRVDPLIIYQIPHNGKYTLEIKDALYRGREDFSYRIELGELPIVKSIYPLGGQAGKATKIHLEGVNLAKNEMVITPSKKTSGKIVLSTTSKSGLRSNDFYFDVSDRQKYECEVLTHNKVASVQPGYVINSKFLHPYEQHLYSLRVDNRIDIVVEVKARSLGAPTDVKMDIFQGQKRIVKEDDTEDEAEGLITHFADPIIMYRLQPGNYTIRLQEAQNKYGEDYAYRLYVMPRQPDFHLFAEPGIITIPRGGSATLNFSAQRKYKFNGPIKTKFDGLPLSFDISYAQLDRGEKKRTVTITAPMTAQEGIISTKITATGEDVRSGKRIVREAHPVENMMQAFYYTHNIPAADLQIRIIEPQPFSIVATPRGDAEYREGEKMPVDVSIIRHDKNYSEPIQIIVRGAKNGSQMEADAVTVTKDQDKATIYLKFNSWKKNGLQSVIVTGIVKGSSKRIKGQGRQAFTTSVTAISPAITVQMPDYSKKRQRRK
ncbi:MAG: hypothetical protein KBS95_03085 [Alistipes sp.]|nr:hypothetical protein [Candidatus Alistipes equi]